MTTRAAFPHEPRARFRLACALALAAALATGGCGSDDDEDAPAGGHCIDEQSALAAQYSTPDGDRRAEEITGECALNCLGSEAGDENVSCINGCVQGVVQGAITEVCTSCLAESADCARVHCLASCMNPQSADCVACQCESGCVAEFEVCSGLSSDVCGT